MDEIDEALRTLFPKDEILPLARGVLRKQMGRVIAIWCEQKADAMQASALADPWGTAIWLRQQAAELRHLKS
jgi:hypothetical protein